MSQGSVTGTSEKPIVRNIYAINEQVGINTEDQVDLLLSPDCARTPISPSANTASLCLSALCGTGRVFVTLSVADGSGTFILDPDLFHPGSRIPDPITIKRRRGKNLLFYLFFEPIGKNSPIFYPKFFLLSSLKYGLGIRDTEKACPGSEFATLGSGYIRLQGVNVKPNVTTAKKLGLPYLFLLHGYQY